MQKHTHAFDGHVIKLIISRGANPRELMRTNPRQTLCRRHLTAGSIRGPLSATVRLWRDPATVTRCHVRIDAWAPSARLFADDVGMRLLWQGVRQHIGCAK